MTKPGKIYILATPLGHLEDMTIRGMKTLKEVGLVAAEDTRRTLKLLSHFGIKTRLKSYREENHKRIWPQILSALLQGTDVALVTDAGTPCISDPGAWLVREASAQGIEIVPIPGPSAVVTALSVSGLSGDGFVFAGFVPAKPQARRNFLESLKDDARTQVFFEAPHRLAECLEDAADILGARDAVLCRELTKINEEIVRGVLPDLAEAIARKPGPVKGEITLVVAGVKAADRPVLTVEELSAMARDDLRPVKEIVADLKEVSQMSSSDLYRLVLRAKKRS